MQINFFWDLTPQVKQESMVAERALRICRPQRDAFPTQLTMAQRVDLK